MCVWFNGCERRAGCFRQFSTTVVEVCPHPAAHRADAAVANLRPVHGLAGAPRRRRGLKATAARTPAPSLSHPAAAHIVRSNLLYLLKHNNIPINLDVSDVSYLDSVLPTFLASLLNFWALIDVKLLEPPGQTFFWQAFKLTTVGDM